MTVAAILARNLTKDYADAFGIPRIRGLDGLDLEVAPGQVFGLIGPNGSGKTTTIRLLLGLIFPTSGSAEVLGHPPGSVAAKSRIGYLPEETALPRFLTGEEALEFYGRLFDLPRQTRRRRIAALLDMVGMKAPARRQIRTYSKGQARRIGLAQALINDPDLVILDEPTSGMDPAGSREIKDLILRLKEQGKTVLLSSHLLADVEDVCDRLAILERGRVRTMGTVAELLESRDEVTFTARGMDGDGIAEVEAAIRRRGELLSVSRRREKLENLFLRIVGEGRRGGGGAEAGGPGGSSGSVHGSGPAPVEGAGLAPGPGSTPGTASAPETGSRSGTDPG
ncbi:MAG: ABC transporter ATP-binding protein [Planctomycetota bacterium]|nr:ABC transporter ATP-binding protein [Planctomycetota bacterium]